jgi:hypothetical protein
MKSHAKASPAMQKGYRDTWEKESLDQNHPTSQRFETHLPSRKRQISVQNLQTLIVLRRKTRKNSKIKKV